MHQLRASAVSEGSRGRTGLRGDLRRRGCEALEPDVAGGNGVLLYGGQPRELPPAAAQGTLF
jgi:hypothetical protein